MIGPSVKCYKDSQNAQQTNERNVCIYGYALGNTLVVQSFLNVLTKNKLEF